MSADGTNNTGGGNGEVRHRRGSITQAAMSNLFQRGNSNGANGQYGQPINDAHRRRLSVTTLGLSGSLPNNPAMNMRRGSMSTNSNNSDSIDENAIDDDDPNGSAKTAPTTPFTRRMSLGGSAMRGYRPGGSPGNGNKNPSSPPPAGRRASHAFPSAQGGSISAALSAANNRRASIGMPSSFQQASNTQHTRAPSDNNTSRPDQQGFNWSEQLRSRAESSVSGARPSFSLASTSPPRHAANHDRAKSVSDMPAPPAQAAAVKSPPRQERQKPDAFQERILKGDFYMD